MNETKATQLIDKFFEGSTTLSEEQQLYDYFTSPNVGPELMPVRQMFLDMCQLQGCEPTPKAQVATLKPRRRWRRIAAAAALVATAGIIATLWFSQRNTSDYEIVAYGVRQTDRETVMNEVERTLGDAKSAAPNVGAELKDAFGQY